MSNQANASTNSQSLEPKAADRVGGTKKLIKDICIYILLVIGALFYLVPFFMVIINSFKQKKDIIKSPMALIGANGMNIENYTKAFKQMEFVKAFCNSLFITGLSTVAVIILSAMVAYYIVRANTTIAKVIFALMISSMIIPFQSIMIPLVSIYGAQLGMLNHRLSLVFMHTGFAMSMSVFMYAGFLRSGVPRSLEEAAYIDGCTKMQTFRMIVFPLLKPTTATLVILHAMQFWNDYLLPSLVLGKKPLYTLPLSTYSFYGTYSSDYGLIMAALVLTLLPILILYFFLQKQIIAGMVAGAVK